MWLTIVLQIIAAIPSIIRIVKEIIDLIHGMPKAYQADAGEQLKSILSEREPNKRLQRLQDLKDRIRGMQKP